MTSTLQMEKPTAVWYMADEKIPNQSHIMKGKDIVGTITMKDVNAMTVSALDDVYEEEMEVIYPTFRQLQVRNALYLDEIIIQEEKRYQGIGQDVMASLFSQNRPIFLYSLAEAEEFWEKLSFKNICGYYYVWNPPKEALS